MQLLTGHAPDVKLCQYPGSGHIRCDGQRDSPLCVSRSAGAVISHTERERRGDRELDPHSYDQQVGSVSHRNKETIGMKQKDRPLQLSTACT